MDKVLMVSDVTGEIDKLIKARKNEQNQISKIQNKVDDVINLGDSLKGEGGEAIKNYFNMLHKPALSHLDSFYNQYIEALEDVKKKISSYESENAVVRETFIENDAEKALNKIDSTAKEYIKEINKQSNTVSDIFERFAVTEDGLHEKIHDAKHIGKETVEKLNKLDEDSKSKLSGDPAHTIQRTSELVNKMKGWSKNGVILKKDTVKEIKNYFNEEEKHKELEKAKKAKDNTIKDLDKTSQAILNRAYKDLENGEIDKDRYDEVLSVLNKTKGELREKELEELKEKVPKGFVEYLNENHTQIARDLGVPIGASIMQNDGSANIGALIQSLNAKRGPKGSGSFKMIDPESKSAKAAEPFFKGNKSITTVGRVTGRGFVGLGAAVGMYDDYFNKNKSVGEATTHNAASTGIGLGMTSATTAGLTTLATIALGSNPVGWTAVGIAAAGTAVGVGATMGFNYLYDHNIMHIQDGLDMAGKGLNWAGHQVAKGFEETTQTVSNIVHHPGEAVNGVLGAVNPFG